jgi:hypothetical protein
VPLPGVPKTGVGFRNPNHVTGREIAKVGVMAYWNRYSYPVNPRSSGDRQVRHTLHTCALIGLVLLSIGDTT